MSAALPGGANYAFTKATGVYFNVKNITHNPMR
jgi:hypothetical protein